MIAQNEYRWMLRNQEALIGIGFEQELSSFHVLLRDEIIESVDILLPSWHHN